MYEVVNLIIPFIALVFFSVMIDKLVLVFEAFINRVSFFPDYIEWYIAYVLIFIIAFIICWQGNWSFFSYLDINFNYEWEGYALTALVISGGSTFVKVGFTMIETIPTSIQGVFSSIKKLTTNDNSQQYNYGNNMNYNYSNNTNYNQNNNIPTI